MRQNLKKKLIASLSVMFLLSSTIFGQITEEELNLYLSKSITVAGLNALCKTPTGHYDGKLVAQYLEQQEEVLSGVMFQRYQDMLRLIENVEAKFVTDAVTRWGGWDWPVYMNRCSLTVRDIKAIDSEIVVQGSLNEYINFSVVKSVGEIPDWVFEAFEQPVESRKFDMYAMAYDDYKMNESYRWSDKINEATNDYDEIVLDISKLESRMWFYYQSKRFIDFGCESLSFSQIEKMNEASDNFFDWEEVFKKVRTYAAAKEGTRFLLITGHTHGVKGENGDLLLDFCSYPSRMYECGSASNENGGPAILADLECLETIYTRSLGGVTPSGWFCENLPVLIFIDNNSYPPNPDFGKPRGECSFSPFNFDEITWFALQPTAYRNSWLRYAYDEVHELDSNAYLALPVLRTMSPSTTWSPIKYYANNPNPNFFPAPLEVNGLPVREGQLDYAGYGQEDVIKSIFANELKASFTKLKLFVYPNPSSENFNIIIETEQKRVNNCIVFEIYSSIGKLEETRQIDIVEYNEVMTISSSDWANGVYFVKVKSGAEVLRTLRLVKIK